MKRNYLKLLIIEKHKRFFYFLCVTMVPFQCYPGGVLNTISYSDFFPCTEIRFLIVKISRTLLQYMAVLYLMCSENRCLANSNLCVYGCNMGTCRIQNILFSIAPFQIKLVTKATALILITHTAPQLSFCCTYRPITLSTFRRVESMERHPTEGQLWRRKHHDQHLTN